MLVQVSSSGIRIDAPEDLGRLAVAVHGLTRDAAASALRDAGLGRFTDGETVELEVAAVAAAASGQATVPDWRAGWEALVERLSTGADSAPAGTVQVPCAWRESSPYEDAVTAARDDPEDFWLTAATAVTWERPPTTALDERDAPLYRWFPDGMLNTCVNAVDRHVAAGRGAQRALVYESPVTGSRREYTYARLLAEVERCAGMLRAQGVGKGDRVVVYLPMVPEAVVTMLACARLGAVHSVVFGGFAARELALRIDDARPKVIVAGSCGVEPSRIVAYKPILDQALELATHRPELSVLVQRPELRAELGPGDADWHTLMESAQPADPVPVLATDPLYILYTSGTTGKPKGVVRDNGGHAVALTWSMRNIFDTGPGQVFWAASDVGWVVGHSYIVYGPLLTGATTVLYEGKPVGTPDAGALWRVAERYGVETLFTAPTALRAVKKEDPDGTLLEGVDLSRLRLLFLAGERLDPDTYEWASRTLGVPVIDNWWQTETGWPIVANPRGLYPMPLKPGSPSVPVPGYRLRILDEQGHETEPGTEGAVCLELPLPPGTLTTLWEDDERYRASYLEAQPGHFSTGDGGFVDADGYVHIMGRTDDVINVAGHRLSTGSLEAALASHSAVAEAAVIGVHDALKGQVPRALVVLKAGAASPEDAGDEKLRAELVQTVRDQVGAVAALQQVDLVTALPKTRSGKILRKAMRRIADGHTDPTPPTIEDPAALEAVRRTLDDTAATG